MNKAQLTKALKAQATNVLAIQKMTNKLIDKGMMWDIAGSVAFAKILSTGISIETIRTEVEAASTLVSTYYNFRPTEERYQESANMHAGLIEIANLAKTTV